MIFSVFQSFSEIIFRCSLCVCGAQRHLDLDHNALVSLPDAVGQLRNLRYLSVMKNQLQHLPETLGDLKMLTRPASRCLLI